MNRERFDELMELAASGCLDDAAAAEFERALAADPALRAEADADRRLVGVLGRAGQIVRATRRAPKGLLHGALKQARAQQEVETSPLPHVLKEPRAAKVIDVTPAARGTGRRRSALPWMMVAAGLVVTVGVSFLAYQMSMSELKTFQMADAQGAKTSLAGKSIAAAAPVARLKEDRADEARSRIEEVVPSADSVTATATIDGENDIMVAELVTEAEAVEIAASGPTAVSPDGTPSGAGETMEWNMAAATVLPAEAPSVVAMDAGNMMDMREIEAPPATEETAPIAVAMADDKDAPAPEPASPTPTSFAPDGTPMRAVPASAAGRAIDNRVVDNRVVDTGRPAVAAGPPRSLPAATTAAIAQPAAMAAPPAGVAMATGSSVADAMAIAEVASRSIPPDEVAFLISNAVANGAVLRSARAAAVPAKAETTKRAPLAGRDEAPAGTTALAASGTKPKGAAPLEELTLDFPNAAQYQAFRWRVETASMAKADAYRALNDHAVASSTTTSRGTRTMVTPSQTPAQQFQYQQAPGGEAFGARRNEHPIDAYGAAAGFAAPANKPLARGGAEGAEVKRQALPMTLYRSVDAPVLVDRFATDVEQQGESPRVRVRIRALPGSE